MAKAKYGEKECLVCHFFFSKDNKLSKKQWLAKKYCSLSCYWKVTPLLVRGRKPWNYKGVTTQNKLDREKFRRDIQKLVFERDDYTCQFCARRGVVLQVDHIQPWAEYVELRFDINNCRTLCVECHYKITFGKPMPKEVKSWGQNFMKGTI